MTPAQKVIVLEARVLELTELVEAGANLYKRAHSGNRAEVEIQFRKLYLKYKNNPNSNLQPQIDEVEEILGWLCSYEDYIYAKEADGGCHYCGGDLGYKKHEETCQLAKLKQRLQTKLDALKKIGEMG